MMFTAIICVEVILFVIWFVYKIVCMMLKHKVLTSVIIIGALYLMISGHSNNVETQTAKKIIFW
ncbi:hypothetical protein BGV40_12485 [Methanosarcina sp. Ant1]|nr:hypothetical protein BGV40_12485 [Methanosarcina sp. Ant1]